MKRFLFDSNAMSAYANHRYPFVDRVKEARMRGDSIGTCEPVVAELYYGLELSDTRDVNIERMERAISRISVWPFDRKAAREYGRIASSLRRQGLAIQIIDMMVAAVALTLPNCTVVTTDSDFGKIRGLRIENWADPMVKGS